MSSLTRFSGPLDLRIVKPGPRGWLDRVLWPPKQYELLRDLEYHVGHYPSDHVVRVPAGYVTDGATVPRGFRWVVEPVGQHAAAAVIHDYLISDLRADYTRKEANDIFAEALEVLGIGRFRRALMVAAVRLGAPRSGWRSASE